MWMAETDNTVEELKAQGFCVRAGKFRVALLRRSAARIAAQMHEPTYKTAENDLEIQLSSLLKRLINGLYGSAQQKF